MATPGKSTALAAAGDLKRILGFRSLFCVAIGLVVAQNVMVALLNGAGQGGWAFLAVLLFAYLLTLCYASSFAELALMFPRAGTLSTYTEVALGHFPAIVATFCGYIMVAIFGNSAELMIADEILARLLPLDLPPMTLAFSIIVFLTTLNLLGVDIFDKFQSLVVFMMVVALLIIGGGAVSGVALARPESISLFEPGSPLGWGVIALLALAMWGFVGAEFVCPLVEETQQPERNLPRAMFFGSTLILVIYLLFTAGALLYVPGEALANSELPHFDYVQAVFGEPGMIFLTVAVITATCSTLNTSIAAISRIVYGMACNGQFFALFKKVHPKYQTPWAAILLVAFLSVSPILFGAGLETVITQLTGASISWLLAYVIAHVDVLVLRRKLAQYARPFKTPFYPVPQILGAAGMLVAIGYNAPSLAMVGEVFGMAGLYIGGGCAFAAVWVKFVMKRRLFEAESVDRAMQP